MAGAARASDETRQTAGRGVGRSRRSERRAGRLGESVATGPQSALPKRPFSFKFLFRNTIYAGLRSYPFSVLFLKPRWKTNGALASSDHGVPRGRAEPFPAGLTSSLPSSGESSVTQALPSTW